MTSDSMEIDNNDQYNAIIQILSILYCRNVFQDFRRPVLATYPSLAAEYLAKISSPMDLGSLLLKALNHELSVADLRHGLQLICHNSLLFNKGTPYLEAMTKHLESTAEGLFEELLSLPYFLPDEGKHPYFAPDESNRASYTLKNSSVRKNYLVDLITTEEEKKKKAAISSAKKRSNKPKTETADDMDSSNDIVVPSEQQGIDVSLVAATAATAMETNEVKGPSFDEMLLRKRYNRYLLIKRYSFK